MAELILSNGLARYVLLALVFALFATVTALVASAAMRRSQTQQNLRKLSAGGATAPIESLSRQANDGAWARLADTIEAAGLSLADTKNDVLRKRLVAAGFESPSAPRVFTLIRLAGIFVLPVGYVLLATMDGEAPSFASLYLTGSVLALLGVYIPNLFLRAKADRRREAIINGFPDCLDLLLICVEAGLSLEAALDRVGREMVASHPLIARMLSVTTLQLRAGASRESALRSLGERTGVDEIKSFATLLIQSDRLGTSIATTLRVYATEMREKRRMRAEEKAHRLPVLISIPLVTCMLPVMIGVLMLPAAVRVVREIAPALQGGQP